MKEHIGDLWCKIEIYNEYLKKIAALLVQIQTVEKMQAKAETELAMLESKADDSSKVQYENRLTSTRQQCEERLHDMLEELSLVQKLKEDLEQEIPLLKSKQ